MFFACNSQMRHTATQVDAILSSKAIPYLNTTLRDTPSLSWGRYIPIKYGEQDEADRIDLSNCTKLATNVGQWPDSTCVGDRPWSIQHYFQVTTALVATVLQNAPHLQGNICWVSTQLRMP